MSSATPNNPIDLEKILAGAQLPALPQSAIRLLELSKDPNNGPAEFAQPIETDLPQHPEHIAGNLSRIDLD